MIEAEMISSKDYLAKLYKKEADIPVEQIMQTIERLSVPIRSVAYGLKDSVELQSGGIKLQFDYAPVEEESMSAVRRFLEDATAREKFPEEKFSDINGWKELRRLEMNFSDNSEKNYFIKEALPNGSRIFFYPNREMINGWAVRQENGNIYVIGDPAAPITLITILHEVGHILDFEKLDKVGLKKLTADDSIYADEAEHLRKERSASAFALKILRVYLKRTDISIKDALLFLKHYALESHRDESKAKIAEINSVHHFARHMEHDMNMWDQEERDREMYDDYLEWKKSDEYVEWRKIDKYKDIDEFDEFSEWRKWCEENGKDWWNRA